MLDEALATFLEEGLAIHIGTRDERLEPNGARVTAVKVLPDRRHLVAYVPEGFAPAILADLTSNGQAALCFARPVDEQAYQVKGVFVEQRPVTADDQPGILRQSEGMQRQLEMVGIPRVAYGKWKMWPCVAITIRITDVFNQTPGPGAGAPVK
jgi:hypothetical protein